MLRSGSSDHALQILRGLITVDSPPFSFCLLQPPHYVSPSFTSRKERGVLYVGGFEIWGQEVLR